MPLTRSQAARTASAPPKSPPTLLRSFSEPLPPSHASSISATSPRLDRRPHGLRRSRTSPTQGGKRLGGGGGEAAKAQVSRVVVYAVFASCGTEHAVEEDVRRCSGVKDETTTRPKTPTSNELAPPPSSLTLNSPSLVLPSPSSSPSLSPRAPPSSPASLASHVLPLPPLTPTLSAIGIDLARCRLRACTCSPDYDSGETTSSDEDGDEL
ncbi:hypothetical protein AAT19DRAFT_16257 [Rhodotorula toruloides]|uniref:Uncharacterized protein n=1 Tax=Rhodotorula toruloides TaxID=5286 RepID=A0A2T0A659_RHOTO|nr:hypothetical protein AAT19DRAFT_16257 [Rhodotorula toruloides]